MIGTRRLGSVLAAVCVAAGVIVGGAAPGSADSLRGINCVFGTQHQVNNPGLAALPRDTHIKITGQVGGCVDPLTNRPQGDRVSAQFEGTGEGLASCEIGQLVTLVTYRWNNGRTSRILFASGVDLKPAGESVVVVYGDVVAGDYVGHKAVKHITLLSNDPFKCFTDEGVREVSGSTDLQILPL